MLTDCSSIQGSITSSSSDVMTLTTASSWCAIPTSSRLRVLRLIRPHARRLLVAPDTHPSYGFAVRGGKEFGIGFFVSNVERNSEADLKGLRIGDQILRINGFRVDDAVHKEFVQFVTSQDRITLKVRGIGMLPTKDKEDERISWNVVKSASVSNTPSESSFKSVLDRDNRNNDINIVLNVAPRTKLGLGICKGPEWKPGIFVQFTKDKSVAREAGLRQGDQILSVNSIDFSDVLFSEAVAVMKGSNKLEMVVRTAAGCDLFPGESSGYNSSASSVTGDQSPCWADAKSKRLTAVREEPNVTACWNESLYSEHRSRDTTLTVEEKKTKTRQVNKTIIKLSENGASINNTYVANTQTRRTIQQEKNNTINMQQYQTTSAAAIPPPPPPVQITELNTKMSQNLQNNCYATIQTDRKNVQVEVHRTGIVERCQSQQSTLQRCNNSNDTLQTNAHTKYKLTANTTNTLNNCRTMNSDVGGSSLSSAITEELKKRKEKKRLNAAVAANSNSDCKSNFNNSHNNGNNNNNVNNSSQINCNNKTNISHNNQQQQSSTLRQQQLSNSRSTAPTAIPAPTNNSGSSNIARTINSANVNCIEQQRNSAAAGGSCSNNNTNNSVGDHHSALMDEFKRAHQRMFKNGFQESERKERQEALKRTTIMEDDVNHRSSRIFNSDARNCNEKLTNGSDINGTAGQQINNIPPPPPQFANSPPKTNQNNIYKSTQKSSNLTTLKQPSPASTTTTMSAQEPLKPPTSPTPDYDNVQLRKTVSRPNVYSTNVGSRDTINSVAVNTTGNRRTMRLGTVTIGEYEQQRKEPTKFEFISAQKRNNNTEHSNTENLHAELQNTLTRSNLKKPNGHAVEHKSDCPLQNGTSSADNLNRKMQGVSIGSRTSSFKTETYQNINGNNANAIGTGNGILKNGNRLSSNGFNKSTDKSITFGNSQKF